MIVGAKCNITYLALRKVDELFWGIKYKGIDDAILENYTNYLNCNLDSKCYDTTDEDCSNPTIVFNCSLSVNAISSIITENTIKFFIKEEDFVQGKPPYTYHWTYEQNDFDNSGPIDTDESVLTVKIGKDINLLVSSINVLVTDANNCIANKTCYLTPTGMKCANDYVPCPNTTGLRIVNKTKHCVGASGLIVSKK